MLDISTVSSNTDLGMSRTAEDSGSLCDTFGASAVSFLWSTLKALEHEVVSAADVCSVCSSIPLKDDRGLGSGLVEQVVLEQDFPKVLERSKYCWFCRFLCRIIANVCSRKQFKRCVSEQLPIILSVCHGRWQQGLLLLEDSTASGRTYYLNIGLPEGDDAWQELKDPDFNKFFTCHDLISPPSRRFLKLYSRPDIHRRECFEKIRRWLSLCESRHPVCRRRIGSYPLRYDRFRVIDVNTRILLEPGGDCSYIALSYVWGDDPFSKACPIDDRGPVLSDQIRRVKLDEPVPEPLPQTIEDAITVTRNLGQSYLWVDLLCIDQFDVLHKENAIATMDKIYSRASLTICVLDGSSMFSGIPGIVEPLYSRHQVIADTETHRYQVTPFRGTSYVLGGSHWANRTWTFQEGELSTRRLCFSEHGVFLRCKEEIFHDVLELDESENRTEGSFDSQGLHYLAIGFDLDMQCWDFDTYAKMAASFSQRSMTFPSDAYNAIRGAVQRLSENLGVNFIGALPLHDICNALLWFNHDNSFRPSKGAVEGRRRPGFPSWSWLGWEGPVEYWYWIQDPQHSTAKAQSIYSRVDRKRLDREAVRLRSSAIIFFDSVAPDTSNAVLNLTTTMARFSVVEVQSRRKVRQDRWWLLLGQNGQKVNLGWTHFTSRFHYHSSRQSEYFCSLHLHSDVSAELTKANTEDLEFVLLQHWGSNSSESVPGKFMTRSLEENALEYTRTFEDTIWALAIKRRPDGVGERLNLVSIPAKAWFKAKPQSIEVRIA